MSLHAIALGGKPRSVYFGHSEVERCSCLDLARAKKMTLFLVSSVLSDQGGIRANEQLKTAIDKEIAEVDRLEVQDGVVWLINFDRKAEELATKLGVKRSGIESALIVGVDDVAGFGPRVIADWMKQQR